MSAVGSATSCKRSSLPPSAPLSPVAFGYRDHQFCAQFQRLILVPVSHPSTRETSLGLHSAHNVGATRVGSWQPLKRLGRNLEPAPMRISPMTIILAHGREGTLERILRKEQLTVASPLMTYGSSLDLRRPSTTWAAGTHADTDDGQLSTASRRPDRAPGAKQPAPTKSVTSTFDTEYSSPADVRHFAGTEHRSVGLLRHFDPATHPRQIRRATNRFRAPAAHSPSKLLQSIATPGAAAQTRLTAAKLETLRSRPPGPP